MSEQDTIRDLLQANENLRQEVARLRALLQQPSREMDAAGYEAADTPWKHDRSADLHLRIWRAMANVAIARGG